jgi:hypothetical protein
MHLKNESNFDLVFSILSCGSAVSDDVALAA